MERIHKKIKKKILGYNLMKLETAQLKFSINK